MSPDPGEIHPDPGEIPIELEQILRQWGVISPAAAEAEASGVVVKFCWETWCKFLIGVGENVYTVTQEFLNRSIGEVNKCIAAWNARFREGGNQLREVVDERIARLLDVNRATVFKWRHNPDSGVKFVDYVRLLYVLDTHLAQAAPRQLPEDLDWAGRKRAMEHVLPQFVPTQDIPALTPEVWQALREDRLEELHRAHTDAYLAALIAQEWGTSQLPCIGPGVEDWSSG